MMQKLKKSYRMQVERILLPRFKILGWILVFFSLLSFAYGLHLEGSSSSRIAIIPEIQTVGVDLTDRAIPSAPLPEEVFNFFSVAAVFLSVGAFCIITSKRRLALFSVKRKDKSPPLGR